MPVLVKLFMVFVAVVAVVSALVERRDRRALRRDLTDRARLDLISEMQRLDAQLLAGRIPFEEWKAGREAALERWASAMQAIQEM